MKFNIHLDFKFKIIYVTRPLSQLFLKSASHFQPQMVHKFSQLYKIVNLGTVPESKFKNNAHAIKYYQNEHFLISQIVSYVFLQYIIFPIFCQSYQGLLDYKQIQFKESTPTVMRTKLQLILVLALITILANCWSPDAQKDRVQELQGYMNFTGKFEMFSGYLELQKEPEIKVHYLFVTSTNKPLKDDVVLWLNGGPGCSSLLGFAQEIGPNMLYSGSMQFASTFNPYSWNQKANLLFFQAPPGVGFSINKDKTYVYNESRTASDNTAAVKAWFARFPQLISNNFWITGESYCGMYIPNFASTLIDANQGWESKIRFKGVMIGNGVMITDRHWRRLARNKFYSKHYFYGTEVDNLIKNCQYDDSDSTNPSCIRGNQIADQSVVQVNPYATIGICYTPKSITYNRRRFYYTPFFEQNNPKITNDELALNFAPCTDDDGMSFYFNQAKIKEQLHVDPTVTWESCNQDIGDTYHKDASSVEIFKKLKAKGLKILLYSGNTDAVVSYIETFEYIKRIGWKELEHQTPFDNDRDSLMGWWTEYDGLTLAIINGAGHMVPSDKPHAAYEMFSSFLLR